MVANCNNPPNLYMFMFMCVFSLDYLIYASSVGISTMTMLDSYTTQSHIPLPRSMQIPIAFVYNIKCQIDCASCFH